MDQDVDLQILTGVMRISPQAKDVPELAEYLLDVQKRLTMSSNKAGWYCLKGHRAWYLVIFWNVSFRDKQRYFCFQIAADNGVGRQN